MYEKFIIDIFIIYLCYTFLYNTTYNAWISSFCVNSGSVILTFLSNIINVYSIHFGTDFF